MKTLWAVACAAALIVSAVCLPVRAEERNVKNPGKASAAPPSSAAVASPSTAAPVPSQVPPAAAPVAGPEYRLGPEDILKVSVWENKDMTMDVAVRPDGKISLPLVQDVQAEGLTAAELASSIHQKLKAFVVEPQVSVIVIQVNAPRIFVIGNVAKPGTYLLRSDVSILQALAQAGGFTQFASPRSIKLVRGTGKKQEVRKINYYNLLEEEGEGNYMLKPGDTIVVP
ncbi:MAG: polysaccharide biosynthesis/export family protein [Deltaproteobacteria bacterium]|nr:polysaccharide biosynthesis/export family protein [Deltaproteobacteria bacterium]